ncbi:hypothetical protein GCM10027567_29960 [Spongiibacter taiwanensis]
MARALSQAGEMPATKKSGPKVRFDRGGEYVFSYYGVALTRSGNTLLVIALRRALSRAILCGNFHVKVEGQ